MPAEFWQEGDMPAALASRHMGRVVRAYRKHPFQEGAGLSQEAVGAWIGITQAQLSRIENGPPIVHLDRLIQWARVLRIPPELLWFKLPEDVGQDRAAETDAVDWSDIGRVREASVSIRKTLERTMFPTGTQGSGEPSIGSFERRLLDAWAARHRSGSRGPLLLCVGGFAGSGKTEFGRFVSGVTGWAHLDKDVLTRPLVERLLASLDADPNDRHTKLYWEQVRPIEYRCLLAAAFDSVKSGVSTVLTAPFAGELSSASWLLGMTRRCATAGVELAVIWVDADVETMHGYLQDRDAARDAWKLDHWDDYLSSIDLSLRPPWPHFLVDNSENAAVSLAAQAEHLVGVVGHGA